MQFKTEKKPNYHGPLTLKLPLKTRHDVDRKKSDLARTYEVGLSIKHGTQDDQLFTVKSLAEYLAVSDQWVYERIQKHEIPVLKIGKFPRFRKSDIEKWLDTLKTPAMNVLSSRLKSIR